MLKPSGGSEGFFMQKRDICHFLNGLIIIILHINQICGNLVWLKLKPSGGSEGFFM